MGVDRTDYLMFGVKLDYDVFDWDKHEVEAEGGPDAAFDLVQDGMGGKYVVAGKIIARSDPYEGIEFREIATSDLPQDVPLLARTVSDKMGVPLAPSDFKLFLFSHFS